MGNTKRWTVTYTKHIKQKRKVYQDGFLELQDSTNKVMLHDECDKLLECRLLKKDEIVTSGETLMFDGYLIDVGDPEGDSKPISDSNVDRADKNTEREPNRFNGSNFRIPSDDIKTNIKECKTHRALSPSQKIIKEFKRRELLKYGSPKIRPETTKPSTSEWQVLYTTQVTQKAKKYHDGFLQLVICGSRGRQVMLFDASRKLLDSRFLKKNDLIRPGESLAFDSYLVDIGENQGNHEPHSSVHGDKCTGAEAIRKMHRKQCSLDTHVTAGKSGKPYSKVYLAKEAELNFLSSGSDVIRSNRIVPPVKPLRDTHQILSILQNHVVPESNIPGARPAISSAPSHGSCENLQDRESVKTMKYVNIMSSKDTASASGDASLQFTDNIETSHQPYSQKEAQTITSEADFGFSMSSSGGRSSCFVTSDGKSDEEFSCTAEMKDCPSFGLGF